MLGLSVALLKFGGNNYDCLAKSGNYFDFVHKVSNRPQMNRKRRIVVSKLLYSK